MNNNNRPCLKKTRTLVLKKSPSLMDVPNSISQSATTTTFVPRKSPLVEFPTSAQLVVGEDILHFSHPLHPLSQVDLPDPFTCSGCKEHGAGKRYTCQLCDFQLHHFCGLAPSALRGHPLHCQHQLVFYSKPVKGGIVPSKCDVCSKPIKGYAFRCSVCSFQMHPCCAMLSSEIKNSTIHPHTLKLLPAAAAVSDGVLCGECKRRRSGRMYRCSVCDYHLHAVCAKNMINGLRDNGIKDKEKPSVLGSVVRLASQVVGEFIGGLFEGIGEGVGEVIVQNIPRSSGTACIPTNPPVNNSNVTTTRRSSYQFIN
ncbi:hypothetical protein FNV43_RR12133 [Rhamnella rubrinervis]|uniref:Phorbol-ester/DAG-type domain-containing protein n=1 Tax=Rhamnella rubrinervis TaxID=2594499 RepID=A0A8K0H7S9_9ROSA|nr:hypothetical protein FNV43_RR12133 [Rhamnella rubrinervis]